MFIYEVTFTDDKALLIYAEDFFYNIITNTVSFMANGKNVALFRWHDIKSIVKVEE